MFDAGNYTLRIEQIKNGLICEIYFDFKLIRSVLPHITKVNYKELSNSNFIEIIASGDGDFEYSIDGQNYQQSNYFSNVPGGVYTVYVRDIFGCGEDSEQVTIIDYPKFFTPNNDGYNDYWHVQGIATYTNSQILIFDRYGKLIVQLDPKARGWDGNYKGAPLRADDYWFQVDLDNGVSFSGHFALKR